MTSVREGRLIIDSPQPGSHNMAVDEALLIDATENGIPTLRFYGWSEPTLSLGYFQRYDDRGNHPVSNDCAVVRRQTGGGAILHDRELTYSLTLPASHRLAKQHAELYAIVHAAFINAISPVIESASVPWKLTVCDDRTAQERANEPFLCFQRRAFGDVVLVAAEGPTGSEDTTSAAPRAHGTKILGSAQRRFRGAILQHGSLLLQRSPFTPELAGLCDLVSLRFDADSVSGLVAKRLENALSAQFRVSRLALKLQSKADELTNTKYGTKDWTKRR